MATAEGPLGELLVDDNIITRSQLNHALQIHKEQEQRERLGDILADLGYITRRQLRDSIKRHGKKMRIGDVLVENGTITREQLQDVLGQQALTGDPLGKILLDQEIVGEEELARALSRQLDIPYVVPQPSLVDIAVFSRLPERFLKLNSVIPMLETDGAVTVVLADPTDQNLVLQLEDMLGADVELAMCSRTRIADAIESLLLQKTVGGQGRAGDMAGGAADVLPAPLVIESGAIAEQHEVNRASSAFDYIVYRALQERASDIHIEPERDRVRIRFRIDGALTFATDLPLPLAQPMAVRAKALAGLDISKVLQQQEGRILADVDGEKVDLRVAVCRVVFGEAVAIRIFRKDAGLMDLDELGMLPAQMAAYTAMAAQSSGVALFAGPTGAGKTTTLYATLNHLNDGATKIVTVEAPVEYAMEGVVQNNLAGREAVDLPRALFGVLHHDPDVIALGEIDTSETVEALLECALMGHKVFATLHAEETASAIVRLANVSGAATFLASADLLVLAQRLVRKVCPNCSEVYVPRRDIVQQFQVKGFDPDTIDFRRGTGCQECLGSGFRGRTGVFELFVVGSEMRDVLLGRPAARELIELIRKDPGFLSLKQAGFVKAVQGITTLEEVLRVAPPIEAEVVREQQDVFETLIRKAGLRRGQRTGRNGADVADR